MQRRTKWLLGVAAAVVVVAGGVVGILLWQRHNRPPPPQIAIPIAPPAPLAGEQRLAVGLNSPTGLTVLPDGRVLVTEQNGDLRLVDAAGLQPTPVLTAATKANDEEGLVAVVADPHFEDNGFIYVTYTAQTPHRHQRVSRFTMKGDTAAPDTEKVLIDGDNNTKTFHLGGALTFMKDGTLLFGTGEKAGKDSQSLDSLAGKVLRINSDGSIPTDDPFFGDKSGFERAIWAYGFRNPYAMSTDSSGRVLESDVGEDTYEEINQVERGNNYGWPKSEGPTSTEGQTTPVFAYGREDGCAIIGGAFAADGGYLFMDYCKGTIRKFDPDTKAVSDVGVVTGEGPSGIATSGTDFFYVERGLVLLSGGTGSGYDEGALYRRSQ